MVLITGASSGIGRATAQAFAQAGHPVWILARRKLELSRLQEEIQKQHAQSEVQISVLDVSNQKAVCKWAEKNKKLLARVEILVNNAGLASMLKPIQEATPEEWDIMWDTNVKGLLYITHQILPHILQKKRGHIVNIGSIAGRWIYPKGNIYCASKSAVNALTEAFRLDLHGTGIRVTEIIPGMVETEFSLVRLRDTEKAKKVYEDTHPLKAEDIAEAILWATQRPSHVNIQEIVLYPTDQASPSLVVRGKSG